MTFAFARIGAAVAMRVEDYYPKGKRWWVRLHEKGGKRHEMPAPASSKNTDFLYLRQRMRTPLSR
jgi:integrase